MRVPGYSFVAQEQVDFEVKVIERDGRNFSPFRESIICPKSKLNNRLRAVAYLMQTELNLYPGDPIYIGEQVTPFFNILVLFIHRFWVVNF